MATKNKTPKTAAASATVAPPVSALAIFDRFKAISELKPVAVTAEGWGLVYVLPLTAAQTETINELDAEPNKSTLVKSVIYLMCDVDGKRVFEIGNPEHFALVQKQPQEFLLDFLTKAQKALGTGKEGTADTKKD